MKKLILFFIGMSMCAAVQANTNDLRRCFINNIKVSNVRDGGHVIASAIPLGSWGIDLTPGQSYCHFADAKLAEGTITVNGGKIALPDTCKVAVRTAEKLTFIGTITPQGYNVSCVLSGN